MRELALDGPVIIETSKQIDNVLIAREDKLLGGTKARFLPAMIEGRKEVVYGGPFCGGAAVALAAVGQLLGIKVTLFYAARKELHKRQLLVQRLGATIHQVKFGYLSHVSCVARKYADESGALYLRLGYDVPEASAMLLAHLACLREKLGAVDVVYTACGTGMLARCLAITFHEAEVVAVGVGLHSRLNPTVLPGNIRVVRWGKDLSKPCFDNPAPDFSCCPYYERKAWSVLCKERPAGRVLFWNVLGDV